MLKANFTVTETGGTGVVQLQSSSASGATWQNVSTPLTLTQGSLVVDDTTDVEIDTSVFIPGETYQFRLTDTAGTPISNVYTVTVPAISGYVTIHSMIDLINTGGDNWDVSFHIAPISYQGDNGVTITSYDYKIIFDAPGTANAIEDGNKTSDYTKSVSSYGAGIYNLQCIYNFSNGLKTFVTRLVKVDDTGNIIADIQFNGTSVISQSGLNIKETAYITQTGVNYDIYWLASGSDGNNAVFIGSGATADLTLPTGTVLILVGVGIDADHVFDDFQGDPLEAHSIVIS